MNNILLNEGKISDLTKQLWDILKQLLKGIKDITLGVCKTLKLDEIGNAILSLLRSLPIIGRIIPQNKDPTNQVKEITGTILIGDCISIITSLMNNCISFISSILPTSLQKFILKIFDYNDRQSFLQALYKIMLDANIPVKYANAYLVLVAMKIPMYNILYVFKPIWYKGKVNLTDDDKLHPFTAGLPNTNPETGLNETEQRLQKKIQKFIQIKKLAELEERDNNLDLNRKLCIAIIKEAVFSIIPILTLNCWMFFKTLGLSFWGSDSFDYFLNLCIQLYFYHFLITGLILTALAVKNEQTFNPKKDNDNIKRDSDGTISFH